MVPVTLLLYTVIKSLYSHEHHHRVVTRNVRLPHMNSRSLHRLATATISGACAAALISGCSVGQDSADDAESATTSTSAADKQDSAGKAPQAEQQAGSEAEVNELDRGIQLASAGKLDEAETVFQAIDLNSPQGVAAQYNLGLIEQARNNSAGAIAYYDSALNLDNAHTSSMFNKALLIEADDPQQALEIGEKIVELKPDASTTYLLIGRTKAALGDAEGAAAANAKAVELDPNLQASLDGAAPAGE